MSIRILIADDSALFRQGVRETLQQNSDWEICGEALDGPQAIERNRTLAPDLIIMDFSMPGMTGFEAASEILRDFPNLPILLLTLYLTRQLAEQAHFAGVRGTLSKTAMHHLSDCIEALLRGEHFTVLDACPQSLRA